MVSLSCFSLSKLGVNLRLQVVVCLPSKLRGLLQVFKSCLVVRDQSLVVNVVVFAAVVVSSSIVNR